MPGRTVVQDMPIADSQGLLDEEGGADGTPKKTPPPVLDLDSAYYSLPKGELGVAYDRALAEKKRVVVSMSTFARMYPKKTAARAEAFMKQGGEIVGKPGVSVDDLAGGQAEQYLKSGLPVTFNLDNLIHGDPAQTVAQWQPAFRSMMDQGFTPRVSRQTLARLYPNDPNRENRARLGGWELYDTAPARDVIGRIPRQEPAEMAYFALDEVKAKKDGSGRFRVYVSSGRAKDQEKQLSAVFGGAPRSIYSVPVSQLPQDLQVEYQASSDGSVVMEGAVADLPKSFKPWQQGLKRFFAVDGKTRAHPQDLASGEYIYNVLKDPNKNLWQKGWTALMGYTLGQAGKMAEEVGGRLQQTAEIATMGLNTQVNPKAQKATGRFSIGALNVLGESISGIGRAAVELSTPESGLGIGAYIGNVATFGVPSVYSMSKSVNHRIARGVDPYDAVIRSVEDTYGPMVKAGNKAAAIVYAKPAMIFGLAEALYSGTMAAVTGQEKPGEAVGPGAGKVDEFKARPVSTAFSMFGIPANGLKAMGFSDEFAQEAEGILMLTAMDGVMRAASARAQYKAEQPGRIAKLSAENTRLISDLINQRREVIQATGEPLPPWLDPQLTTVEAVRSAQQSIGQARDAAKADMADHFLRTAIGDEFMRDVQAPTADQLRMLAELQRRQTATGPEADYYKKTKLIASEEAASRTAAEERITAAQKAQEAPPLGREPLSAEVSAREFQMQQGGRTAAEVAGVIQRAGEKLPGEIAAERAETQKMWEKKGEASRANRPTSAQESGRMLTKEPQRRASQSAEVFASENAGKITPRQLVEDVRAGRITIQDAAKQLRGLLETGERWRREQNASEIRGDQTVHAEEVPGRERGGGGGTRIEGLRGNPEAGGAAHPDRGGEGTPEAPAGAPEAVQPQGAEVQKNQSKLTTSQIRELEGLIADGRGKRLTQGGGFVRDSKGNIVKRIGAQSGYGKLFRYLFGRGEKKGKVQEPGGPLPNKNKYRIFEVFEKAIRGEELTAKQQGYVDTALNAARTLNEDAYRQSMVSRQHGPDAAEAAPFYEPLIENDYEVVSLRNLRVGDTYTHAGEKFTVTAREGDVVEVQDGTTLRLDPEHETILIDKGSLKQNINEPGAFEEATTEPPPAPTTPEPPPAAPAAESVTIRGQEFKYADMPDVYKRMPEAELQRGVKNGEAWPQLELQHRGLGAEKQPITEAMREKADALEAKAAEYRRKTGGANANPFADPNMWGSATYQLAADLIRGAAHVVDFATWSAHAVKQFGEQAQDRLKQMWEEAQRLAEAAGWVRPEEPAEIVGSVKPRESANVSGNLGEGPIQATGKQPVRVGFGSPEVGPGNIVSTKKPSVPLADKIDEALLGQGWLYNGETKTRRAVGKLVQTWVDDINRLFYATERLTKSAGWEEVGKIPLIHEGALKKSASDPRVLAINWQGLHNRLMNIVKNGMLDPNQITGERLSEPFMQVFEPLKRMKGDAQENWMHVRQLDVARRTLEEIKIRMMEADTAIADAEKIENIRSRIAARNDAEEMKKDILSQDKSNGFSGIGKERKISDSDAARQVLEEFERGDPNTKSVAEDISRRLRAAYNSILEYAKNSGRISEDKYKSIVESREFYTSFKRNMEGEFNVTPLPEQGTGTALAKEKRPTETYKGSARPIEDPFTSLLRTLHDVVKETDRNTIWRAFDDLASETRKIDPGLAESIISDTPQFRDAPSITYYRDGKPVTRYVEPMFYEQMKKMGDHYNAPAMVQNFVRFFKATVTHTPAFALLNWGRAVMEYPIISGHLWTPLGGISGTMKLGLAELGVKRWVELKSQFEAAGGGSHLYLNDRKSYYTVQGEAIKELQKNPLQLVVTDPKMAWKAFVKGISLSESGPRFGEFLAAKDWATKNGMNEESAIRYAASQAAGLPNFARAGRAMRAINEWIPFSNPAAQGVATLVRAWAKHPAKSAAAWAAWMLVPRLAEFMYASEDQDRLRRWQNIPSYQRDMFANFELPGGFTLSVPLGFEMSVMSSGFSRALDAVQGKNEFAWKGWSTNLRRALMPVDFESIMSSPLGMFFELGPSYDYFQQRHFIPPHEQERRIGFRPGEKYASPIGQIAAGGYNAAMKAMKIDSRIDPREIDHVVKRLSGRAGTMTTSVLQVLTGQQPVETMGAAWTGMLRSSPTFSAESVNDVRLAAKMAGESSSKDMRELSALLTSVKEAKTPEERQQRQMDLLNFAESLRQGKYKLAIENPDEFMRQKIENQKPTRKSSWGAW